MRLIGGGELQFQLIAPLCNAMGPLERVRIDETYKIERWPREKLFTKLNQLIGEDHHRESELYQSCLHPVDESALIIVGEPKFPDPPADYAADYLSHYTGLFTDAQERLSARLAQMRIFHIGNVREFGWWWFGNDGSGYRDTTFSYATCELDPYELTAEEVSQLNEFLGSSRFPPFEGGQEYVGFAFDNYDEAYETRKVHLQLLNLVIALEALFNVSRDQGITYRISRGAAVLLGQDRDKAQEVFDFVRQMYIKRSEMVHQSQPSLVTRVEVAQLREIVRNALFKIALLGIIKLELDRRLTAGAFGGQI